MAKKTTTKVGPKFAGTNEGKLIQKCAEKVEDALDELEAARPELVLPLMVDIALGYSKSATEWLAFIERAGKRGKDKAISSAEVAQAKIAAKNLGLEIVVLNKKGNKVE